MVASHVSRLRDQLPMCRVRCNAYVALADAPAATEVHFDNSSLIALQLSGSKLWSVGPPTAESRQTRWSDDVSAFAVNSERWNPYPLHLAEGDVGFVCRGAPHQAYPVGDGICVHLTLMIFRPTVLELLTQTLLRASNRELLSREVTAMDLEVGSAHSLLSEALMSFTVPALQTAAYELEARARLAQSGSIAPVAEICASVVASQLRFGRPWVRVTPSHLAVDGSVVEMPVANLDRLEAVRRTTPVGAAFPASVISAEASDWWLDLLHLAVVEVV